jgi:riboflavin kinase/FMN adenylyltransferase
MTVLLHETGEFRRYARESVVTIGVFDGVHRGHQAIISACVGEARKRGAASVVLTFRTNPRLLVKGEAPCVITAKARKMNIIRGLGVEYVVEVKFDKRFASLEPEEFCRGILSGDLGAKRVCVGENFRFGAGGSGDVKTLASWGKRLGYGVDVIPLVEVEGSCVSSTLIRGLIREGKIEAVSEGLGRPYSVSGKVIGGHSRGRALGFPTANVSLSRHFCIPADGVYAGRTLLGRKTYSCAINVGSNPTFGDTDLSLEVYLIDFEGEIYGESLEVEFHRRLRDEIAFACPEELIRQMEKDTEAVRGLFGPDADRPSR